ncbi:MAG: hypothetical protein ACJ8FU_02545 [Xanthobacteraceae bacterium]
MNKIFAAAALAALIASPAFAQSSDPSIGSGNIARQSVEGSALGAYAHGSPQYNDTSGRTVLPPTRDEHRAFQRAKGNNW